MARCSPVSSLSGRPIPCSGPPPISPRAWRHSGRSEPPSSSDDEMKAAPFDYVRPARLDDVLNELADGDGKIIAGGQSLVPVLAMRLGRPGTLVDINSVDGLDAIDVIEGAVRIGATVRQRTVELSEAARR